eukprot:COSAG02_NODE_44840_length_362_cov_1.083650_1_plen_35_part_10
MDALGSLRDSRSTENVLKNRDHPLTTSRALHSLAG